MPADEPKPRSWLSVPIEMAACAALGVAISLICWACGLTFEGKSISAAIRGEVEDATGLLQALTLIGGLVGAAVGLIYPFRGRR